MVSANIVGRPYVTAASLAMNFSRIAWATRFDHIRDFTIENVFDYPKHNCLVTALAYTFDTRFLAVGGENGFVSIYSTDPKIRAASGLGLSRAMVSGEYGVRDQSYTSQQKVASVPQWQVSALAFSPDGDQFAVADTGGFVSFYEAKKNDMALRSMVFLCRERIEAMPTAMTYRPDGTALVVGGVTGLIAEYDAIGIRNGQVKKLYDYPGQTGAITSMAFNSANRFLAAASEEGDVNIFDANDRSFLFDMGQQATKICGLGMKENNGELLFMLGASGIFNIHGVVGDIRRLDPLLSGDLSTF